MLMVNYRGNNLIARVTSYEGSGQCLALYFLDQDGVPFGAPTVNLGNDIGDGTPMPYGCAFLDEFNMPGIGQIFLEAGIAHPYVGIGGPVYMEFAGKRYILYEFAENALEAMDPMGFDIYRNAWALNQRSSEPEYGMRRPFTGVY